MTKLNYNIKKLIILIIIFSIIVIFIKIYYNNYKKLSNGYPVFNETIYVSKKNKMFISKYSPLNSDLFNEVWLEKKGYFKDNIINTSIETKLKFSLMNKDFKSVQCKKKIELLKTNFEYSGNGFEDNIFILEFVNDEILDKDTLKIKFKNCNQVINLKLIKTKNQ
jgi:hypothetical protein